MNTQQELETPPATEPVLDSNYRIRMLEESSELTKRVTKLEAFTETETYLLLPWTDRHMIQNQLRAMQSYSRILQQRIKQTTP